MCWSFKIQLVTFYKTGAMGAYDDCVFNTRWSHFSTLNGKLENIANALTLVFILTSNSMLLYGLYKTKHTKGFTNKLFMVMSISDIICGCIVIPVYFANIYLVNDSDRCQQLSQIEGYVYIFFSFSSSVNTMYLSIDRFVFIRYPFKYKQIFEKKRTLVLALYISYSISTAFIILEADANEAFYICSLFLLAFVFVISIALNVFLVKYIRKQNKEIRRLSNTYMQSSYQKRATQTVMVITLVLVLTHLPQVGLLSRFLGLKQHLRPLDRSAILYFHWARLLVLANAGMNASIFISRNKPILKLYRNQFKRLSILKSSFSSNRN